MPGPYFTNQIPNECGCYYPDVVLLGDKPEIKKRILYCINHGEYEVPLENIAKPVIKFNPIPTEEWREKERQCLISL